MRADQQRNRLYSSHKDGYIYCWDISTRKCISTFPQAASYYGGGAKREPITSFEVMIIFAIPRVIIFPNIYIHSSIYLSIYLSCTSLCPDQPRWQHLVRCSNEYLFGSIQFIWRKEEVWSCPAKEDNFYASYRRLQSRINGVYGKYDLSYISISIYLLSLIIIAIIDMRIIGRISLSMEAQLRRTSKANYKQSYRCDLLYKIGFQLPTEKQQG